MRRLGSSEARADRPSYESIFPGIPPFSNKESPQRIALAKGGTCTSIFWPQEEQSRKGCSLHSRRKRI